MNEHIKIYHEEKIGEEKYEFRCSFSGCNKPCKSKASLDYHFRNFHEEKNHFCKFCDKEFIYKNILTFHIKSKHKKEIMNPYKCEECCSR